MNSYQLTTRDRKTRRFSMGDGVRCIEGPNAGRVGVVMACGGNPADEEATRRYSVCFTDSPTLDAADLESRLLASDPAGNTGKYGGPSRGGSMGGYVGGNNYRQRG